jgi:phosphoribosylformylglycinamidine (FGAM) synthase-like amidotransferase family enzyme
MHITINKLHGHKVFKTAAEAEAMIAIISDDDGLTYRVVVDPNGSSKAIIEVVDEDGTVIDVF